ncbi:2962_t:CDS:2, partial [Rhizophagus irregularis]
MVNIQLIELNLKGTQILNSDSRPRNDKKRKRLKERRYQYVSEMTKDLREALRRDLFWNLARMPQETQLDIEKTFESQKDLVVKTIVPNLMKILDLDTYLIGE